MQLSFLLHVSVFLASYTVNAAPIPGNAAAISTAPALLPPDVDTYDDLIVAPQAGKLNLRSKPKPKSKTAPKPTAAPKNPPPKPAASAVPSHQVTPPASPPASLLDQSIALPPSRSTDVLVKISPAPTKTAIRPPFPVLTVEELITTSSATETSSADDVASSSADFCPLYNEADAQDISQRDLERLYARAGKEFWFRWDKEEDAKSAIESGKILELAPRAGDKTFDDQAYKWIASDVKKATRSRFQGTLPVIYVLPAGTRDRLLSQAKRFEDTSAAQKPADFVTKDHEQGDLGINGIAESADGTLPLEQFRNKVVRTVMRVATTGSAQFVTIKRGKVSRTAAKKDQELLVKFC